METARFNAAQVMLDDARHLLSVDRWASAISRAYYSSYQGMWAALGAPPQASQWVMLQLLHPSFVDTGLCQRTPGRGQDFLNLYDDLSNGFI